MAVALARSATAWLEHPALSAMTLGILTVVGLFAAAGALRFAMRAASVDAEHLYAALSAYCSPEFSSVYSIGSSNRAGLGPSPSPVISRA